jgi:outer membrane protein TolC
LRTFIMFIIIIFLFAPVSSVFSTEGVLTWQDCVSEALQSHPDLVSAKESIRQAKASKNITESGKFPQVAARLSQSASQNADSSSVGINGSRLIYDGSKTNFDIKAAEESINGAEYAYQDVSSQIRLRLRTAFLNLLKSQELIPLSESIVKRRKDNVELVKMRYNSGREHKGALLTAEANLAQAEFDFSQAERDLIFAQAQLCREIGRVQSESVKIAGVIETSDTVTELPAFESLAENHPQFQRLVTDKNTAEYGVKSSKSSYYPTVSVQGSAGKAASGWLPEEDQWSVGFSVSYPIFDGGRRTAEVAQAQARLNKAQADTRSGKDGLGIFLRKSWTDLLDAIDNVNVRGKFLSASSERSRIAQAQYSIGLVSFDNWTIIEDDLVRSEKDYLNARTNACLAEASWIQAKGDTLENK